MGPADHYAEPFAHALQEAVETLEAEAWPRAVEGREGSRLSGRPTG